MTLASRLRRLTLLDCFSILLIMVHLTLLIGNRQALPFGLDTPYHLLMGKMFADYDTVVLWDYYEYAPLGRPHLYPPFEHILIWIAHDLMGVDYVGVGRLITVLQYPVTLFASWLVMRLLFDDFAAASFLGLFSADSRFWNWQLTVAPTALILLLYFPFQYFLQQRRRIASVALMTIFLYSHLGLPYVIVLSAFISAVLCYKKDKGLLKETAIVVGASFALFLPWIIHLLINREAISAGGPMGMMRGALTEFLSLDLLMLALLPLGIYRCIKGDRKERYFLGSFLGFLFIIPTYGWRYFTHSGIVNSAVSAIGYRDLMRRARRRLSRRVLAGVTLGFVLFSSIVYIAPISILRPPGGQPRPPLAGVTDTPLVREITAMRSDEPVAWRVWDMTNPDLYALSDWIIENTKEDEIIHLTHGALGATITLLTGRRTDSGMYREVKTDEMLRAVEEGRKSGIFVFYRQDFKKQGLFELRAEVLAEFGEFVVFYATGLREPEELLLKPASPFVRLKRMTETTDPELRAWKDLVMAWEPERLSIGIHQADADSERLKSLIFDLNAYVGSIEVSLFVDRPDLARESLISLVDSCGSQIDYVRIAPKDAEMTSPELLRDLHGIAQSSGLGFGLGIIGPPLVEERAWERPEAVAQEVEYLVRHVPPTADFIELAIDKEMDLIKPGKPFLIQIDMSMAPPMEAAPTLLNLIFASQKTKADAILIEISDPRLPEDLFGILMEMFRG